MVELHSALAQLRQWLYQCSTEPGFVVLVVSERFMLGVENNEWGAIHQPHRRLEELGWGGMPHACSALLPDADQPLDRLNQLLRVVANTILKDDFYLLDVGDVSRRVAFHHHQVSLFTGCD